MALAYVVDSIPEGQEALYKAENGKFVLDVQGVVPASEYTTLKTKLDEFRTTNIALKQSLEDLTKAPLGDRKVDDAFVNQLLDQRVAEMKTNYTTQVTTLTTEKQKLEAQLEQVLLSDAVKDAAIKYGVLDTALPDVISRAKDTFTIKDGAVVSKTAQLDKEGKPVGVATWVQSLSESASHLFATSRGSGATKPIKGQPIQGERTPGEKIAAGLAARNK